MILSRVTQPLSRLLGVANVQKPEDLPGRAVCEILEAYYYSNDLYRNLAEYMKANSQWSPNMKSLRNPVFSAVEFYAMTLWPGPLPDALPIETKNARIVEPIQKIHQWSNWGVKKQMAARQFAMVGDLFLRVEAPKDAERVYIKVVPAKHITDFDVDERGFVTWLRYEVVRERRDARGEVSTYVHTEVWSRTDGIAMYRLWEHNRGFGTPTDRLGPVTVETDLSAESGIDFLPWVHAPFRDVGEKWGMPLVWPVITKIDDVNQKATRLAEMLFCFNKAWMFLKANMVDSAGRPMPAPKMSIQGDRRENTDRVTVGDMEFYALPGNSSIEFGVPNINWTAHAEAIQSDLDEIERDLPEVAFYAIVKDSGLSGRALQLKMGPAIMRVTEARGNAESALVRAHQMALSIGAARRLPGFESIGTYDAGDFDHTIGKRDVIPMADQDAADLAKTYIDMGVPMNQALERYAKWTPDDATRALQDSIAALTPEQAVQAQEAAAAAATKQIVPMVDRALKVIGDGALQALVDSGAIEKLAAAKGNGAAN